MSQEHRDIYVVPIRKKRFTSRLIYLNVLDVHDKNSFIPAIGNIVDDVNKSWEIVDTSGQEIIDDTANAADDIQDGAIDASNIFSELGGSIRELIKSTEILIPEILTTGLWVYDDDGNLTRLTLELPHVLELSKDVSDSVTFTLFTNNNKTGEPIYLNDTTTLKRSNFNRDVDTVFVTHGWMNSAESPACTLVTDGKSYKLQDDSIMPAE